MAKIFETSEHATEVILQTHYYKTSYEKLKNCYLEARMVVHSFRANTQEIEAGRSL